MKFSLCYGGNARIKQETNRKCAIESECRCAIETRRAVQFFMHSNDDTDIAIAQVNYASCKTALPLSEGCSTNPSIIYRLSRTWNTNPRCLRDHRGLKPAVHLSNCHYSLSKYRERPSPRYQAFFYFRRVLQKIDSFPKGFNFPISDMPSEKCHP